MTDFSLPVNWNLPLSGAVNQSFPWTNNLTVNFGPSSDPDVEREVLSVASYGKQLGRIADALIVLLRHLPDDSTLGGDEQRAIADFRTLVDQIADAKQRKHAPFVMRPSYGSKVSRRPVPHGAAATMTDGSSASIDLLQAICDAFNAHDLDRVMAFFADDCVLQMPRGADPWGTRYFGKHQVREGLASRFAGIPDVHYGNASHYVCGDVGISQWTLTGTTPDGNRVEVLGCDFYTFRDGKVIAKDSYWKIVESKRD